MRFAYRSIMSMILCAFVVGSYPASAADKVVKAVSMKNVPPKKRAEMFSKGFDVMDKDRSTYIEIAEAPPVQQFDPKTGANLQVLGGAAWINHFDSDHSGKVSKSEYVQGFEKMFANIRPDNTSCVNNNCPPAKGK